MVLDALLRKAFAHHHASQLALLAAQDTTRIRQSFVRHRLFFQLFLQYFFLQLAVLSFTFMVPVAVLTYFGVPPAQAFSFPFHVDASQYFEHIFSELRTLLDFIAAVIP